MTLTNLFILLTGISGSGKSCYGEHLRDAHGFHFIETDRDVRFINEVVGSANPELVASYLRRFGLVAVEWGFFPHYLSHVLSLKKQGAKLLWFRADEATARWSYCIRWDGDARYLRAWEDQMDRIKRAHLPTPDFQVVDTFRDGRFRFFDELDAEILGR